MKLTDAYNKYAKAASKVNHGINKVVGKDVLGDVKGIDEPKDFPPFESYEAYSEPEPEQWTQKNGAGRSFTLGGNVIEVSETLDLCMLYRKDFISLAQYYTDKLKFRFNQCINDYDSFGHYFMDVYNEGLESMYSRALGLLLSFGVVTINAENIKDSHSSIYHQAYDDYVAVVNVENERNQQAQQVGNTVGNSVQMQSFGLGMKNAMKGFAKSSLFNAGMGFFGKMTENQLKMSQEDKAKLYNSLDWNILFQEVLQDYTNVFYTFIKILIDNRILKGVSVGITAQAETAMKNMENPMFPQDQVAALLADILSKHPFSSTCLSLIHEKMGLTEETEKIYAYYEV